MATFVEMPDPVLTVSFFLNGAGTYIVPADQYLYVQSIAFPGLLTVDGVSFGTFLSTDVVTEAFFGPGTVLDRTSGTVYIIGTLYEFGPLK